MPAAIIDELSSNDVSVQEGETVPLVCNVTGIPHPTVTWFRRPTNGLLSERESKLISNHDLQNMYHIIDVKTGVPCR